MFRLNRDVVVHDFEVDSLGKFSMVLIEDFSSGVSTFNCIRFSDIYTNNKSKQLLVDINKDDVLIENIKSAKKIFDLLGGK